jgi:HPt (histidine-containing phosphotransfer) domain-containing protein
MIMPLTFNNPPDGIDPQNASLPVKPFAPRSATDLKSALDNVWQQSRPIIVDRLNRLDAFVLAVAEGTFTQEQFEDATTIAHSFAGSLGMFGYPEGTVLARSMEQWLDVTPSPNVDTLRDYVTGLHSMLGL